LRAAVESQACVSGERSLASLNSETDRAAHIAPEASNQSLELRDSRKAISAQRANSAPRIGQSGLDETACPLDRFGDLLTRLFALSENTSAL
jgi:hypothetical protein